MIKDATSARVLLTTLVAAALLVAGLGGSSASASMQPAGVVSTTPATYTPDLAPDAVISHPAAHALEQGSALMYVGGQFDAVQNGNGAGPVGGLITRQNFVAFNISDGQVSTAMAPAFNGDVWAIRYSAGSIYVGGEFTTVNGVAGHRGIVKLDAATGAIDPNFSQPWASGRVYDLQVVGNKVIAGGTFDGALVALDPATGANLHYFDSINVSGSCVHNAACGQGTVAGRSEATHVYRFAVSPDGSKLVAIGNFASPHPRAFMVDLGATGTLDGWYYTNLARACIASWAYPAYLRDVAFAPDSSYFVIAATGYVVSDPSRQGLDVCDAAAKFTVADKNPARPVWINYTGGDTLHAVVITNAAVYVQGHNRWLDNPTGKDTCLTTCVSRPGIGAIDPTTGRALPWNPTKTRNVGGKDLLSTSQGIWVASDGANIGKIGGDRYHYGIALMPL